MPLLQQSVVAYDETEAPQLRKALQMLYPIYQRLVIYILPCLYPFVKILLKHYLWYSFSVCTIYYFLQVANHQPKDVMDFIVGPKTEFQRYIRLNRKGNPPSVTN